MTCFLSQLTISNFFTVCEMCINFSNFLGICPAMECFSFSFSQRMSKYISKKLDQQNIPSYDTEAIIRQVEEVPVYMISLHHLSLCIQFNRSVCSKN